MSKDETILLAVKSLLEVVQTGAKNIEISVLQSGRVESLSNEEIVTFVNQIEEEKTKEAEKKKSTV